MIQHNIKNPIKSNLLRVCLAMITFLTLTNYANSQYFYGYATINYCLKKGKTEFEKIKTDTIYYLDEGTGLDEIVNANIEDYWSFGEIKIVDSLDSNRFSIEKLSITSVTGERETVFVVRSSEFPKLKRTAQYKQYLFMQPINVSWSNTYAFKETVPFALKSLSACLETISSNPSINKIKHIHYLINSANSSRTVGKKILFIESMFTSYWDFDQFQRYGVDCELISLEKYKKMTKEELEKCMIGSYGGHAGTIFTLHDPITKDLLYIKYHFQGGFLKAKHLNGYKKFH